MTEEQKKEAIRTLIASVNLTLDELDRKGAGAASMGQDMSSREGFQADLLKYILYLSAADSKITPKEAEFLTAYTGFDFKPRHMAGLLKNFDIDGEAFRTDPPLTLMLLISADNAEYVTNSRMCSNQTEVLLSIYEHLGKAMIACDGADPAEERRFLDYYTMLLRFARVNHLEYSSRPVNG